MGATEQRKEKRGERRALRGKGQGCRVGSVLFFFPVGETWTPVQTQAPAAKDECKVSKNPKVPVQPASGRTRGLVHGLG